MHDLNSRTGDQRNILNISTVKAGKKLIHKFVNGAKKLPNFLYYLLTKQISITVKRRFYKTKTYLGPLIKTELVKSEVVARRCSVKKVLLQISKKFTRKQNFQYLFNKASLAQVYSCEFCKILRIFLQNTSGGCFY